MTEIEEIKAQLEKITKELLKIVPQPSPQYDKIYNVLSEINAKLFYIVKDLKQKNADNNDIIIKKDISEHGE